MWQATLFLVLLISDPGLAPNSHSLPRHHVYSANRAFVLDVNPATQVHHVYSVWDRKDPVWTLRKEIGAESVFLSNDGQAVALIASPTIAPDDLATAKALEVCSKDGVLKSYNVTQLCPAPKKTECGDSECYLWRTESDLEQNGRRLWLATSDGNELTFTLADGELLTKEPAATTLTWEKTFRHALVISELAQWSSLAILAITGALYMLLALDLLWFLARRKEIRTAEDMEAFKRLVARSMFAALAELIALVIIFAIIVGGVYQELIVWSDAPIAIAVCIALLIMTRLLKRLEAKVRAIPVKDDFAYQEHQQVIRAWMYKQLPDW